MLKHCYFSTTHAQHKMDDFIMHRHATESIYSKVIRTDSMFEMNTIDSIKEVSIIRVNDK